MPLYQSQQNGWTAFKVQSGIGVPASGSGGTLLRQTGGAGLQLTRAQTASAEVRRDGMSTKGRLGTQKLSGAWLQEATLGSFEEILAAIMRDTWDASPLALTATDFTSISTATNVLTFTSGNPITLGLRIGDVIRCTNLTQAAGNNVNLRVVGLTATTVTVDVAIGTGAASTTATLTRPKKLSMKGAPVKRYYTIDEYDQDIDLSELATDFMWGMGKLTMQPNGILTWDFSGVGTGAMAPQTTGTSPVLTSPVETTTPPLSVVDATIRVNGVDVVDLTGFDISFDIKPSAPDVFGSGAIKYAPDVFPGNMDVSMNFTALRKDLQRLTDFLAETQYTLHVLAADTQTGGSPPGFLSMYVGNFTLGQAQKSALSAQGGPRTVSVSVPAALVGKDTSTNCDASMVKFQSTSA